MSTTTAGVRLGLLAYQQWLGWPGRLVARLPGLSGVAGDGHFLLAVPLVALLAPPVVILVALVVGINNVGYDVVYTESVVFVAVAVAVGALSTQLGALGVAAFAVGDVIRALRAGAPGTATSLTDVVDGWLPLLVTYLLLFAVVVVLPRTIRTVVAAVGIGRRIPVALAWPLAGGLVVLLTWLAVTAWVAAAPTLIRPVFTWTGSQPTVEAIVTLQVEGNRVVAAAVIAAVARHVWLGITVLPGPWRARILAAEGLLAHEPRPADPTRGGHPSPQPTSGGSRAESPTSGASRLAVDVMAAALATLALSGVLLTAWVWIACFGVFLAVRVLRRETISWAWLQWWKRLTARAPAWLRLLALFLFSRLTVDAASTTLITSYTQLALFVLAGVVLAFAIFPGPPAAPADPESATTDAATGPPRGGGASVVAGVIAFGVCWHWLTTPPAVADNCGSFDDCFSQANTATEAALGLGILAILSLVLNFVPFVGTGKGVVEAVTGRDLLTGEKLAAWERVLGIIPFGRIGKVADLVGDAAGVARHGDDVVDVIRRGESSVGAGRHADDVPVAGGTSKVDDATPAVPPPTPAAGGAGRGSGSGSGSGSDRIAGADDIPPGGADSWGNMNTLDDHFGRHGADFGTTSAEDYARLATQFREQAGTLTKVDPQTGVIRVYEPSTNTFGSYNPDGTTKTFYKPDPARHGYPTNLDYWGAQPG